MIDVEALRREALAVGVEVGAGLAGALDALGLAIASAPMNITSVRDAIGVRRKMIVDSLSCVPVAALSAGERCIDVGSGGGFPGLPVALLLPDVRMVLLEASARKCRFLRDLVAMLDVHNAEVVEGRAEDIAHRAQWREASDCVLVRAVAPVRVLLELTSPLCAVHGRIVALKGPTVARELAEAVPAMDAMHVRLIEQRHLTLPGGNEQRIVVRWAKTATVDGRYPRRAGVPGRRPL